MDDVAEWLPDLLKSRWDIAVDSLRSGGEDIVTPRTEIWPAHDKRSGGRVDGLVRCKVYESGDQIHTRKTHGDVDKDIEQRFSIDLQTNDGGDNARRKVHECVQVIVRLLELYRHDPHHDWHLIEDVSVVTVNNYGNYQQRVVNLTLRRYGQVLVDPIRQVSS